MGAHQRAVQLVVGAAARPLLPVAAADGRRGSDRRRPAALPAAAALHGRLFAGLVPGARILRRFASRLPAVVRTRLRRDRADGGWA